VTHDDDRTKRIADNSGANTIGMSEQGVADAVKTAFKKKGDELRNKLQNIGFDENQAKQYEAELDKGDVLLIVTEAYGVNLDTLLTYQNIKFTAVSPTMPGDTVFLCRKIPPFLNV